MPKTKSRDPERLFNAIRRMRKSCPDLRVGQIIVNALPSAFGNDPFYIENDDLATLIEKQCEISERIDRC